MTTFVSPVSTNSDESAVGRSPNGLLVAITPSQFPDAVTYLVPSGAGYLASSAAPLRVMGGDGRLFFVANGQTTPLLVVGPAVGDPGVVVPALTRVMLASTAAGAVFAPWGGTAVAFEGGFQTRAAMAAFAAASGVWAYVSETRTEYEFVPGSAAAPDTWNIVASTSGIAGNWINRGPTLTLPIAGGGADDWVNFGTASVSCAALGIDLLFQSGTYQAKSKQLVPSKLTLRATPTTIVIQTLPQGDPNQANTSFYATLTAGAALALSVAPTVGASSLSVTSSVGLAVGGTIRVAQVGLDNTSPYFIRSITPAGPNFTIGLDRPILFAFSATAQVFPATVPSQIRIFGNGMTVTGAGDRLVEIVSGIDCSVDDIRFVSSTQNGVAGVTAVFGFDVGGVRNRATKIYVDGSGQALYGYICESQESLLLEDCEARGCGTVGAYAYTCMNGVFSRVRAHDCSVGIGIELGLGDLQAAWIPTNNFDLIECVAEGSAGVGIIVDGGALRVRAVQCNASYNVSHGFHIRSASAFRTTQQVSIIGSSADKNGGNGLTIDAAPFDIRLSAFNSTNNTGDGINTRGVRVRGALLTLDGNAIGYHQVAGSGTIGTVQADGCTTAAVQHDAGDLTIETMYALASAAVANWFGINMTAAGTVTAHDVTLERSGAGAFQCLVIQGAGTFTAGEVRCLGTAFDIGINIAATSTFRADGPIDVSSATTPITLAVGGKFSSYKVRTLADQGAITIATRFLAPNGAASATEANVKEAMGEDRVLAFIQVDASAAPGATHSTVYTVRKNGVNTAVTVTLGAADVLKTGVGGVAFAAGDYVSVSQVPDGAGNVTADPRVTLGWF